MNGFVLNTLTELPFLLAKEQLLTKILPKAAEQKQSLQDTLYHQNTTKDEHLHCSCGWQGKGSEAKKRYLFVEHTTELELFCQNCDSYLGFIVVRDEF